MVFGRLSIESNSLLLCFLWGWVAGWASVSPTAVLLTNSSGSALRRLPSNSSTKQQLQSDRTEWESHRHVFLRGLLRWSWPAVCGVNNHLHHLQRSPQSPYISIVTRLLNFIEFPSTDYIPTIMELLPLCLAVLDIRVNSDIFPTELASQWKWASGSRKLETIFSQRPIVFERPTPVVLQSTIGRVWPRESKWPPFLF